AQHFIMAFERLTDGLAAFGVPQPRRLVERRGDNPPAVGTERRAPHGSIMAFERLTDGLAAFCVPQPLRVVARRRDDSPAVGTECRAPYPIIMAFENDQLA